MTMKCSTWCIGCTAMRCGHHRRVKQDKDGLACLLIHDAQAAHVGQVLDGQCVAYLLCEHRCASTTQQKTASQGAVGGSECYTTVARSPVSVWSSPQVSANTVGPFHYIPDCVKAQVSDSPHADFSWSKCVTNVDCRQMSAVAVDLAERLNCITRTKAASSSWQLLRAETRGSFRNLSSLCWSQPGPRCLKVCTATECIDCQWAFFSPLVLVLSPGPVQIGVRPQARA
jgi:hypothetical protein